MASATKALPNTSNARSEVSARIKLSRLSTVRRRHSSLICGFELFGNMETVERMVLSRWLLHDTCMSALSLVLVIDMNWINASHQLARLARLARH